ncbi:MAG TPA: ATP-dependent DNA helicase UvrD2, partial [Cellulomonas sp.]|nr:ATP-dependent DNA helicase UvrD2 [Cellulomonas sp.]
TPQVVALANRVIDASRHAGGPTPLELRAQRPDGPEVRFATYDDDDSEAIAIARAAARLVADGTRPSEIAVLYRTNAQSEAFEDALTSVGLGYQVRGGERFFARRDVRDALVLLRGGARAADPAQPMPEAVRDILVAAHWSPEPPPTRGAARERWDAMQALVALADEMALANPSATVADLVAELAERASAQHAPTVEGVTLASLHAAKGLEWDAVFLAGLSEGLLPTALADSPAAVAEERRLLYVGVTRAREHLQLSWARSRMPGGRASRSMSRFLVPLWPSTGRAQPHVPREVSDDPTARRIADRLKIWRDEQARQTGVTPARVLTTTALEAIAARRPTSLEELAVLRGVGQQTLATVGDRILEVVADAAAPAG